MSRTRLSAFSTVSGAVVVEVVVDIADGTLAMSFVMVYALL